MGHFQLHPRPRPSDRPAVTWSQTVSSDAGGRVARRPVEVRYRFPRWDEPRRIGRDGVILLFCAIVGSPVLIGLGVWALSGDRRTLNDYAGAALAFVLAAWAWYISLKHVVQGVRGAGRNTLRGVIVGRATRTFRTVTTSDIPFDNDEHFPVYYLGVDDGTQDRYDGWEVPFEVYQILMEGGWVEAVVSGDRRYLYSIAWD